MTGSAAFRFDSTWILRPEVLSVRQKQSNAAALKRIRKAGAQIALIRVWNGAWACVINFDFCEHDRGTILVQRAEQADSIAHAVTCFDGREIIVPTPPPRGRTPLRERGGLLGELAAWAWFCARGAIRYARGW